MSAQTNHLNDSEEEELGTLIYKSSQTAKNFLLEASSASQHSKKLYAPPSDDCPVRKEGGKLIQEISFRYSLRSASKKLKMGEATDGSSKCTGDNIPQQKQSQASGFKLAPESDNKDDSSDDEYFGKPSSSITSHATNERYNLRLRRASHRQASNEATEPEPEYLSSAASASPPSLSSTYCAVTSEEEKSAEKEGTYTDRKGRVFVIKQIAGKKCKHYCKPEGVNKKDPQTILLCKHPGCSSASRRGGLCVKHGAKRKRCKVEGCTSHSNTNHLCFKHGGKTMCRHPGCTNASRSGGVCVKHGAKRKHCKVERCTSQSNANHLCYRHGAPRKIFFCKHNGCTSIDEDTKGGVCVKHGGKERKHCKVEGCTNQRVVNHLCYRHGAPRKICKHNSCTNIAKGQGVCARFHKDYS
jgi:hypothetical protein